MGPLAIAAAGKAAIGAVQGIAGLIKQRKANKQIKGLMSNQPVYKRPKEYEQELQLRKQMAAQTMMPGQAYTEQRMDSAFASGLQDLKESAISSNVLSSGVGNLFEKRMQAYQDLGLQSAQFQQANKEMLGQTLQRGADYRDTEWEQNKLRPWEIQMNYLMGEKGGAKQNIESGIGTFGSAIMDYAGTKYMGDLMKGMQGGGQNASTPPATGGGFQSSPLGYKPSGNLSQYVNILPEYLRNGRV